MSAWLILLVGGIYLLVAGDAFYHEKYALALTFGAYALSNIGLYLMARGIS